MALSKPFYRIARPKAMISDYAVDPLYSCDRKELSRAYVAIERDLEKAFYYIEPGEKNKETFSFELYSILLRACTEVESNCKLILSGNKYSKDPEKYTMDDYKKIERSSKLSKYKVVYNNWRNNAGKREDLVMIPFESFGFVDPKTPVWYKAYNSVKHGREEKFEEANLENTMNAVAGILVLLYSQYGANCVETYGSSGLEWGELGVDYDDKFDANIMFGIKPPAKSDWDDAELYDFEWSVLKSQPNPIEKFDFDSV